MHFAGAAELPGWICGAAGGHLFFPLMEGFAEVEAKQRKIQPRERQRVNDPMMLFKALDPDSSPNLSQKKSLFD